MWGEMSRPVWLHAAGRPPLKRSNDWSRTKLKFSKSDWHTHMVQSGVEAFPHHSLDPTWMKNSADAIQSTIKPRVKQDKGSKKARHRVLCIFGKIWERSFLYSDAWHATSLPPANFFVDCLVCDAISRSEIGPILTRWKGRVRHTSVSKLILLARLLEHRTKVRINGLVEQ